jgi:hypothetical protein
MTATLTAPASRQRLFDANGNHLQVHGNSVRSVPHLMRELGVPAGLMVMTRAEPRRKKLAEVVLHMDDKPFGFDFRMTSADARALATNLTQAADAADKVTAALAGKGGV